MEQNVFVALVREIACIHVDNAVSAAGGSEGLYEKTLRQMIRSLPAHMEQLDAALGVPNRFASWAHGMRGVLNQTGCYALANMAGTLEKTAREGGDARASGTYAAFRGQLAELYARLADIAARTQPKPEDKPKGELGRHYQALKEAELAADNCDSLAAVDYLAPLRHESFGPRADTLLEKAYEALEAFSPQEAHGYLSDLLQECEAPGPSRPATP